MFIELCCLEFWWSRPTMVLAGDDVEAAALFTLATPLLPAICIVPWTELSSPFAFWAIV